MKHSLIALVLAASSLLVHAEPPSQESIDKLLVLSKAESIFDAVKVQVIASIRADANRAVKGRAPNPEEQMVINEFVSESTRIMNETLSLKYLTPLYTKLYTQYFTQEDIDAVTVFYQTPAGQALVTKMPQLTQGLIAAMPAVMAPMKDQLQAAAKKMTTDLQALSKQQPKL